MFTDNSINVDFNYLTVKSCFMHKILIIDSIKKRLIYTINKIYVKILLYASNFNHLA